MKFLYNKLKSFSNFLFYFDLYILALFTAARVSIVDMSFLSSLTALLAFEVIASAQSSSQTGSSSQSASAITAPSCIQPRQPSDPSQSAILSILTSAVPNACNVNIQKLSNNSLLDIVYYQVDSINFNITHIGDEVSQPIVPALVCPDTFNSIISGCVNIQSSGYWG